MAQIELTDDERLKFRALLLDTFPGLGTDEAMNGGDAVQALDALLVRLADEEPVAVTDPRAPVLVTVSPTDPEEGEGGVLTEADDLLCEVATARGGLTAAERARALAGEVIRRRLGTDEIVPNLFDPDLLSELRLRVGFREVGVN